MTAAPRPRAWQRRWLVAGTLAAFCVLALAGTGWAQSPASGQIETEPPAAGPPEPTETSEQQQETAPKPRVKGGQVTVTAERIDVPLAENPAATSVVDESVLSTIPRGVAADEGLALVPGVTVDNQANSARVHLSIRGQGILTEHGIRGITVRLDGIPLNDPTGFVPDLYDVDWSTVDRIEVLRGPASALYGGGGSGGVVNIVTADGGPGSITGRTDLTLGSNGFVKALAQASGTSEGASYRVSASRTLGDGYRVHTAFDATNLYGKIHLDRGGPFRLSMVVMGTAYFNENAEGLNLEQVQEDPQQANPDALKYNEFQDTHRGTLGLVGSWDLTPGQRLGLTVYGRATGYRESVPSSVIHRQFAGYGASLQYSLESKLAGLPNRFSAGLDLDWQDIDELRHPNLGRTSRRSSGRRDCSFSTGCNSERGGASSEASGPTTCITGSTTPSMRAAWTVPAPPTIPKPLDASESPGTPGHPWASTPPGARGSFPPRRRSWRPTRRAWAGSTNRSIPPPHAASRPVSAPSSRTA